MPPSKIKPIAGWILSGLVAALLWFSAAGKLVDWEGKEEAFAQLGYTTELMSKIGVVELVLAILLLIPRASFLGAVLLTGYLGGATATHVRVGDPFIAPIIVGVVMWTALRLRQPGVFALALGQSPYGTENE